MFPDFKETLIYILSLSFLAFLAFLAVTHIKFFIFEVLSFEEIKMILKGDFLRSQLLGWIEVIMQTIACLVISILMIIYVKYFCIKNKNDSTNSKRKVDKSFHLLLFGSLLSSVIYIYSHYIVHTILVLILGFKPNHFCFITQILLIPMYIQRLHVYMFFIVRLYVTFKGSVVEINKIKIKIIIVSMIILGSIVGIFNSVVAYIVKETFCFDDDLGYLVLIGSIVMILVDNFWLILLSYLYIKKLRTLIRLISSNNNRSNDKLFNVANKLTILAIGTFVSSIIIFMLHIVIVLIFSSIMIPVDLIINNICIMLSFAIFNESYKKCCCCCIKIHNKCCCINNDAMKLIKEVELNDPTKSSEETTAQESLPQ